MIFRKRNETKIETRKQGIQIGDRFAMKYDCLSTSISTMEDHPYTSARMMCNYHDMVIGDIESLWTVVEYIGNGQYLDLVSGEIFTTQTLDETIPDTVTLGYETAALETQSELLEHPISIGSYSGHTQHNLRQLTPEIKQAILEETLPRQEEIAATLERDKERAQELILEFYRKINEARIERYYREAQEENEEFDREQRRIAAEAIRKQQEEERIAKQKQLQKQIDPLFDKMFPKRHR